MFMPWLLPLMAASLCYCIGKQLFVMACHVLISMYDMQEFTGEHLHKLALSSTRQKARRRGELIESAFGQTSVGVVLLCCLWKDSWLSYKCHMNCPHVWLAAAYHFLSCNAIAHSLMVQNSTKFNQNDPYPSLFCISFLSYSPPSSLCTSSLGVFTPSSLILPHDPPPSILP